MDSVRKKVNSKIKKQQKKKMHLLSELEPYHDFKKKYLDGTSSAGMGKLFLWAGQMKKVKCQVGQLNLL
jgi:hypothetical protein